MLDREIGGITCLEVLDRLESYLTGRLDETERGRVEAHLGECDRCARFGGRYAEMCRDLHELLSRPERVSSKALAWLRQQAKPGSAEPAD